MTEEAEKKPTRPFLIVIGEDVTGRKKPTNYVETLINFVKGYVGTGIFALGYAYYNSGLLLGPILMIVIALLNLHCQHLLIEACVKITEKEPVEVLPTFGETVQYTFEDSAVKFLHNNSELFGLIIDICIVVAEYGMCVAYFIFVGEHFAEVAEAYGWEQNFRVFLAIVFLPMMLSTFIRNLKLLAPLSLLANIIMWIGCALLLYYALKDLPPLDEKTLVSNLKNLPLFFGVVLYAFEGITFVIPLRAEMKNPANFTKSYGVLNMSMLIVIILYILVGMFSYWNWGDKIKGSAFLNIPQEEVLSKVTMVLIAIGVMITYTLHMYIPFEIFFPRFHRKYGPFKYPNLVIIGYKAVAAILTYGIANLSSRLGAFISLVGALTGALLSLMVPTILELARLYGNLTWFIILKNTIIIIIAIAGAITGTVLSIIDIVREYTN